MTFEVRVILEPHVQTSKLSEICKRTVKRALKNIVEPTIVFWYVINPLYVYIS